MPQAIVVGGGLAGIAAAVAVAQAGLQTLHVAPKGAPDRRTSALMLPSVAYLETAGLIGDPADLGTALTQIRIIDATGRLIRSPETFFDSSEAGLPAFGWNFANARLLAEFEAAKTKLSNIETVDSTVVDVERVADGWRLSLGSGAAYTTPFLVGSDGKKSFIRSAAGFRSRESGFTQAALVADLELGRPLGGASVEFHYPQGPFTLVPAGGTRANLVWIDDREALRALQAEGADALRAAILSKSQHLFGDIRLLAPAHMFLLSTLSVPEAGHDGVVLAGEAAHAFPPIGAQGLNLGLRDVADLAAALKDTDRSDANWARKASERYSQRRAVDLVRTGGVVDTLFRSLLSDLLPAQAARAGGLWALKLLPPLRKQAFGLGMGSR